MSIISETIITIIGNKNQLDSKNIYKINEDSIVELKGTFRSAGKVNSVVYFGFKCYRENGNEITGVDVNRVNEPMLVTSINTDGKILSIHIEPKNWNNKTDDFSNTYLKPIGIYFDGNVNKLPDYMISSPAYNNIQGNNIVLNKQLPKDIIDKIIPYTTKIMNHNIGNWYPYDYSVICGDTIPEQWKEYSCTYEGFSNGYVDIKGKFRPETRQIRPFVICNFSQDNNAVLEIKNVSVTIKEKPKF